MYMSHGKDHLRTSKKHVKSHNLNVSSPVLQLSLPIHWCQVLSREWRCRWMLRLHLRYQQFYCLLRFDSKCIIYHVSRTFLARKMPKVRSHIPGWVFCCVWKKHWLQPNSGMALVWLCDLIVRQLRSAWVTHLGTSLILCMVVDISQTKNSSRENPTFLTAILDFGGHLGFWHSRIKICLS